MFLFMNSLNGVAIKESIKRAVAIHSIYNIIMPVCIICSFFLLWPLRRSTSFDFECFNV